MKNTAQASNPRGFLFQECTKKESILIEGINSCVSLVVDCFCSLSFNAVSFNSVSSGSISSSSVNYLFSSYSVNSSRICSSFGFLFATAREQRCAEYNSK